MAAKLNVERAAEAGEILEDAVRMMIDERQISHGEALCALCVAWVNLAADLSIKAQRRELDAFVRTAVKFNMMADRRVQ